MNKQTLHMLQALQGAGISLDDALALRRISMTLQRWFELECGWDAGHGSGCIARGRKNSTRLQGWRCDESAETDGVPVSPESRGCGHTWTTGIATGESPMICPKCLNATARMTKFRVMSMNGAFEYDDNGSQFMEFHPHSGGETRYSPIADREKGARKRLEKIMSKYPTLKTYIQGDPRGCALYIIRPGDVPDGANVDSCYSRGLPVYR